MAGRATPQFRKSQGTELWFMAVARQLCGHAHAHAAKLRRSAHLPHEGVGVRAGMIDELVDPVHERQEGTHAAALEQGCDRVEGLG